MSLSTSKKIEEVEGKFESASTHNELNHRPWESNLNSSEEQDPLSRFANIIDVMLVFALGLMVAFLSLDPELKQQFSSSNVVDIQQGKELLDVPDSIQDMNQSSANGMESLGKVYRDPKTGKLILIGQ